MFYEIGPKWDEGFSSEKLEILINLRLAKYHMLLQLVQQ
jgi:hypothetical protein